LADKLQFEVVSPERLLLSRQVDMVVVPGVEGDFGALPGHARFLSAVRPGVIAVYEGAQVVDRIFVAGGFAEVTHAACTVLADEAMALADLDRGRVDAEMARAREDILDAKTDAERQLSERRLAVAEAKAAALDGTPY
jgi:F-type H+-transporting ATPase subunit epsilon